MRKNEMKRPRSVEIGGGSRNICIGKNLDFLWKIHQISTRESIIFNDDCSCFSQLVYGKWNFLAAEIFFFLVLWEFAIRVRERWNRNNNNKLNFDFILYYCATALSFTTTAASSPLSSVSIHWFTRSTMKIHAKTAKNIPLWRQWTTVRFNTPANSEIYCNLSSFSVGSPLLSGCYQT